MKLRQKGCCEIWQCCEIWKHRASHPGPTIDDISHGIEQFGIGNRFKHCILTAND